MIELHCEVCYKSYLVSPYREKISKHCSRQCHNKKAGTLGGKAGKGISRNKGNKRPDLGEYNRTHIRREAQTSSWKGDGVGYTALHNWAHRHIGLKKECENCHSKNGLEMSNKSGQYKRELADWQTLCRTCHKRHDINFRKNGGKVKQLYRWHPIKKNTP